MGTLRIKLGRAGALAGLAVALVIIGGNAQAAPATKNYSVSIVPAATPGTYTLKLSNVDASTHSLGSANVSVPSGFIVTSVENPAAAPAGKSWSAVLAGTRIELRASSRTDALEPGKEVTSRMTVQGCSSASWTSQAKQANDFSGPPGNDFTHVGAFPVVNGAGGAAVALEFVQQPTTTEAGDAISAAVTVKAVNACGNAATGNVAIDIGTNPAGGSLGGTRSQTLNSQGVATFSNLTIDKSGAGYTLTASSVGVSETSDPFTIVAYLCVSTAGCTLSDEDETTTVSTSAVPSGAAMGLSFSGFAAGFACAGVPSFDSTGSLATIDPIGYASNSSPINVTMRWAKSVAPGTGVANFVLCWSKTGESYNVAGACTKQGQLPANVKLCELKRNRNGGGALVIEFLIAPEDPYAGLGGL